MMLTTSPTLLLQHREKFLAFKCDQCDFATALTGGLTRHKIALHYNLREVRIALRRLTQEDIDSFERKEEVNDDFNQDDYRSRQSLMTLIRWTTRTRTDSCQLNLTWSR